MKLRTAKTLARVYIHTIHLMKNKENNNLINKMKQ